MCECNSQSYTFLFSDQFVNTVFWKSAFWYFIAQLTLRWQRKYPQMKTGKKLSQKLLVDMWIRLTELHLCFMEQSINTVFEENEKGFFALHWGLSWKRKFHPFNTWKKLSKKLLSHLWIHLQSYNICLKKPFAKTLFVESGKWYLVAHTGPWWKRKCPHIITSEKLTERLLSDVWLHHTDFHPSLLRTVC